MAQTRKMHIRRLHNEIMGEKSFQIVLNEESMKQLADAMGFLRDTGRMKDDPRDPELVEFRKMVLMLNEALFTYDEGEENCLTVG